MCSLAVVSERFTPTRQEIVIDYLERRESCLFFHGTSQDSAESISELGMNPLVKTIGSDEMMGHPVDRVYNYVTSSLPVAASYAKNHRRPAVVSIIVPKAWAARYVTKDLSDPDAYKIAESVPKEYIVTKSHAIYSALSELVKNRLRATKKSKIEEIKDEGKSTLEKLRNIWGSVKEGDCFPLPDDN
jgi:hypothetical protein